MVSDYITKYSPITHHTEGRIQVINGTKNGMDSSTPNEIYPTTWVNNGTQNKMEPTTPTDTQKPCSINAAVSSFVTTLHFSFIILFYFL